ncbi:MAG: DUF4190 domain-containing protein [Spirochaetaceae bacterium]|jgi:hypothetical protein|nr:DUF4190 domain-containing protein [Spirochaetaceae bacterium]
MGTASLVLGIISIVFSWVPLWNYVALAAGIIAIVFGVKSRKVAQINGQGAGIPAAGLVLGIVGTVLSGVGALTCTLCTMGLSGACLDDSTIENLKDAGDAIQDAFIL